MLENIKEMNLEQVETRKLEIKEIVNSKNDFDVMSLSEEVDALNERQKEIEVKIEKRNELIKNVVENGNVMEKKEDNKMIEEKSLGFESVEYKNAFLKDLQNKEMTDVEKRAFVHTTANTAAVLPKELQNKIYSNMEEQHPLLADVNILRSGTVISIAKHTAIVAGDAKVVAEGVANDDEQNTFVEVVLAGKKFSKHVDFSYELEAMALPAFEQYLVDEISQRLGAALAKDIVDTIKGTTNGLATGNKFDAATPGTLDLADLLKGFGLVKGAAKTFVYVNSATLYTNIATMEGKEGLVGFIPNYQEAISAQVLGKGIKEEDALADGEVLILDPQQYLLNIVKDTTIEYDRDIKKGINTVAGHLIAGGTMTNDKAGAVITVGVAG